MNCIASMQPWRCLRSSLQTRRWLHASLTASHGQYAPRCQHSCEHHQGVQPQAHASYSLACKTSRLHGAPSESNSCGALRAAATSAAHQAMAHAGPSTSEQQYYADQMPHAHDAVLFVGFPPEEVALIQEHSEDLFDLPASSIIDVDAAAVELTLGQILQQQQQQQQQEADTSADDPQVPMADGRVIYFVGQAQQHAVTVNEELFELGIAPAVVGAQQTQHQGLRLAEVVQQLRAAHAEYYGLVQPVETVDGLPPPHEAQVVLNVVLDAGEVPSSSGDYRPDEGHVVVLDGLCRDEERQQLLEWLTAPGHDHSGPPPEDKWELGCVDRAGDQPTWGLKSEVLQALYDDPPPPIVAIQTRLAALYPEYQVCHMPAQQLCEEEESLSAFVGNAVMYGDPCMYHVDADPSTFPPSSPWVHNYGYYFNREPGRPLFVSMLIYLNEEWPEDFHAETMFMDPGTQAGVFVRPAPGRIVLMDQDVPHRISAPSQAAGSRPRYSLVWKLVFFPKPLLQEVSTGPACSPAADVPPLSRPEWETPTRLGFALGSGAAPAWQPSQRAGTVFVHTEQRQ